MPCQITFFLVVRCTRILEIQYIARSPYGLQIQAWVAVYQYDDLRVEYILVYAGMSIIAGLY